jgi:hypothetical protein
VESKVGCGTTVRMQKKMGVEAWICEMGGEF